MIKNRPKHNFKTRIVSLSSELLRNVGYRRSSRPFHALNHSASSGHGMMVDVTVFIAIASAPRPAARHSGSPALRRPSITI